MGMMGQIVVALMEDHPDVDISSVDFQAASALRTDADKAIIAKGGRLTPERWAELIVQSLHTEEK